MPLLSKATMFLFCVLALSAPASAMAQVPCPCVLPNVGGTAVLMPTSCTTGYLGFMHIVNGLPVTASIGIQAELTNFFNTAEVPGGSLGGHIQTFDASLVMTIAGTGSLAGFNRLISVPVSGITHTAPRSPGDGVQSFSHELISLSGQLFGDPDFCTLEVKAGSAQALPPSPGQTTLTRVGGVGTDFEFASFFDITYAITFQGCPGSVLEGFSGTTVATHEFRHCEQPVPVVAKTWGGIKALYP